MFLKPFRVKSQTAIKGSDRKRLRAELTKQYKVDGTLLADIVPNKDEMTVMKLCTHSDMYITVYTILGDPAFFEMDKVLYPTVYTLWKFPEILPVFTTWPPVFKKLLGGADLMLPGVIVKGEVTPNFMNKLPKGSTCAVKLLGNKAPVAVGKMALSGEDMYGCNMRGKGVNILHTYTDQLWALGTKSNPPQLVDPEMLQESLDSSDEEEEVDEPGTSDGVEKSDYQNNDSPDNDDNIDEGEKDNVTNYEGDIDGASLVAEKMDDLELGENSGAEGGTPEEVGEEAEEEDPRSPQEKMDEMLTWCFMCAVKSRVKKSELPLLTSNFFRLSLQPCCPAGQTVDVKKSSYKKLTKFLKAMQDRGYIKVKELSKGVESIIEIHKDHPDFREFAIPDQPVDVVESRKDDGNQFVPPEIVEMFTINAATLSFFKPYGYRKGSALTLPQVRKCLAEYIKENELKSEIKGLVILDPILSDLLLNKGEYDEDLTWENIITRVQTKLNPAYRITAPGFPGVVKKGKLQPILFSVIQRGGNKKVTLVHNLELFGIDPHEFGHTVQIGMACSTAVNDGQGKNQGREVLIQGNQINYASNLLLDRYKVPRKYLQGLEKAPKGKKKR